MKCVSLRLASSGLIGCAKLVLVDFSYSKPILSRVRFFLSQQLRKLLKEGSNPYPTSAAVLSGNRKKPIVTLCLHSASHHGAKMAGHYNEKMWLVLARIWEVCAQQLTGCGTRGWLLLQGFDLLRLICCTLHFLLVECPTHWPGMMVHQHYLDWAWKM